MSVKVGDLVQTIEGWSYRTWTGLVMEVRQSAHNDSWWVKARWDQQDYARKTAIFHVPANKVEVISESRR